MKPGKDTHTQSVLGFGTQLLFFRGITDVAKGTNSLGETTGLLGRKQDLERRRSSSQDLWPDPYTFPRGKTHENKLKAPLAIGDINSGCFQM